MAPASFAQTSQFIGTLFDELNELRKQKYELEVKLRAGNLGNRAKTEQDLNETKKEIKEGITKINAFWGDHLRQTDRKRREEKTVTFQKIARRPQPRPQPPAPVRHLSKVAPGLLGLAEDEFEEEQKVYNDHLAKALLPARIVQAPAPVVQVPEENVYLVEAPLPTPIVQAPVPVVQAPAPLPLPVIEDPADDIVWETTESSESEDDLVLHTRRHIIKKITEFLRTKDHPLGRCLTFMTELLMRCYKKEFRGRELLLGLDGRNEVFINTYLDHLWAYYFDEFPPPGREECLRFFSGLKADPLVQEEEEDDKPLIATRRKRRRIAPRVAPEEDDDEPLVAPRKRAPLVAPLVPRGRQKPKKLKYDTTNTTGNGPWARVAQEAARRWTERFEEWSQDGSIPQGVWDGRPITPDQWNRGGDNAWQFSKFGPDRRSKYQVFTRQQRRERDKKVARGHRVEELKDELDEKFEGGEDEEKKGYPRGRDLGANDEETTRRILTWQLQTKEIAFLPSHVLTPLLKPTAHQRFYHAWGLLATFGILQSNFPQEAYYLNLALDDMRNLISFLYEQNSTVHPGIADDEWEEHRVDYLPNHAVKEFITTRGKGGWGNGTAETGVVNEAGDTRSQIKTAKQREHAANTLYVFFGLFNVVLNRLYEDGGFYLPQVEERAKKVEKLLLNFADRHNVEKLEKEKIEEYLDNLSEECRRVWEMFF